MRQVVTGSTASKSETRWPRVAGKYEHEKKRGRKLPWSELPRRLGDGDRADSYGCGGKSCSLAPLAESAHRVSRTNSPNNAHRLPPTSTFPDLSECSNSDYDEVISNITYDKGQT